MDNGNILISIYYKNNDSWIGNYSCLSCEGFIVDLPVGSYYAIFNTEYAEFKQVTRTIKVIPNIQYYANITPITANNKTINITAKSNIPNDILEGKLLFILPNGIEINANYNDDGTWWAVHTFDDYGEYKVNASYIGLSNVTINNATISINKVKTQIISNAVTTTYNIDKNLVITLKDSAGNPISGAKIIVNLNGAKTLTTDKNGQVKVSTNGLIPKTYTAAITYNGDDNYVKSTASVKVTVNKAKPKIIAKNKIFKKAKKVKKYTITLKSNKIPIKKVWITLKIKGKKIIKAKTNKKGKATFKIKKLTKKGKYKAIIRFNGNKYYKKAMKNVKIKIK